jgi:toxin ParE1/3/4
MVEIRWTIQAVDDLESIVNFISSDSVHYAKLLASDIFEAIERSAFFPESGRVVPELNMREIREILFGNYRIIYRFQKDIIEIITIYHGSRLLDPKSIK